MLVDPDLTRVAGAIGDPTRIRMLTMLMEGRALTAKELSYGAGVEPATATSHLSRLLSDSLVVSRTQGRHKYFNLASPEVAHCLEALMAIAKPAAKEESMAPIREARYCYDHLAGRVAVAITNSLVSHGFVRCQRKKFVVTEEGERWCEDFGIDLAALSRSRRKFAYPCLDWTERKDHLGGALGAALAQRMVENGWIQRKDDTRVVTITPAGAKALHGRFAVEAKR